MKKSLMLLSLALLILVFSCKKDEQKDPFNAAYTDETVEQSKTNVEQNAIDLVDQMDALSTANGIKVIMHLYDLQSANVQKSTLNNPVFKPLSLISSLGDKQKAGKVFYEMKQTATAFESDSIVLTDVFDSIAGKYIYNFETGEFDKTELAGQVIMEFPGLETDLTNTAVITVDNFTVAEISEPMENWPSGLAPQLPASIRVNLKYNGKDAAGISMNASYKSNGMPVKTTVEIYVDDFTFSMTATHSPFTSASWKNTLKFKDAILFETYIAAEGDWSQENIDNSIIETDTGSTTYIEDIINNANAHVILMNLKVIGKVNVKTLGDTLRDIDKRFLRIQQEEIAQAQVDAINANAQLIVIYRDSNKKIAEAEAYVSQEDDGFGHIKFEPSMQFVYADSSKVDIKSYVDNELDSFYTTLNEFIDNLNEEYGLDLNHVNEAK